MRQGDLRALDTLPLDGCGLVTASALLDLVSLDWLRAFARAAPRRGRTCSARSATTPIGCAPADDRDELVRGLVNQHQHTDKGFGPALGPDAAGAAADVFTAAGFTVQTAESDWVLGRAEAELQRQLLAGWAGAARDLAPADAARIDAWLARRLAQVDAGTSQITVGHVDLLARTLMRRDRQVRVASASAAASSSPILLKRRTPRGKRRRDRRAARSQTAAIDR